MSDATWYQQALTPPQVVEIRVRVGLIPSEDHVQVLAEMVDPTTGVQVAMWSHPHSKMRNLPEVLDQMRRRIDGWCEDGVSPF